MNIANLYIDQMLGNISFEDAKDKITSKALQHFFVSEFDKLFDDHNKPDHSNEEISSEWYDEFFNRKKHQTIEALSILPTWFNLKNEFVDYYNRLLVEPWHHNHELLVETIMSIKSGTSTKYITQAIETNFRYLHFDDTNYTSFIRKCMWALADINTDESREALIKYRNNPNATIRQYADEQLRWLNGEKGARYMP